MLNWLGLMICYCIFACSIGVFSISIWAFHIFCNISGIPYAVVVSRGAISLPSFHSLYIRWVSRSLHIPCAYHLIDIRSIDNISLSGYSMTFQLPSLSVIVLFSSLFVTSVYAGQLSDHPPGYYCYTDGHLHTVCFIGNLKNQIFFGFC